MTYGKRSQRKPHDAVDAMKEQIKTLQRTSDELTYLITRCTGKEQAAPELSREIRKNSLLIVRLVNRLLELEAIPAQVVDAATDELDGSDM